MCQPASGKLFVNPPVNGYLFHQLGKDKAATVERRAPPSIFCVQNVVGLYTPSSPKAKRLCETLISTYVINPYCTQPKFHGVLVILSAIRLKLIKYHSKKYELHQKKKKL